MDQANESELQKEQVTAQQDLRWIVCVSDGDRCKSTCTLYRQRGREREKERESVCDGDRCKVHVHCTGRGTLVPWRGYIILSLCMSI